MSTILSIAGRTVRSNERRAGQAAAGASPLRLRWDLDLPAVSFECRMVRFGDIRKAVDGISGKVLTDTLRDLERDGLVTRYVHAEVPPRVEYELTPLGRTLHAPLEAIGRWAEAHISEVLANRETYDAAMTRH